MTSVHVPPAPGPVAGDLAPGTWLGSGIAAMTSAAGGVVLYLSFPPRDGLWWLVLPAFVLLGLVVRDARPRRGFLAGFAFGLGFLLPLLAWTGYFVGSAPWVALSVFESLFFGLGGALMALVSRVPGRLGTLWPVWAAAVWVAGEAVRGRLPFGGFPWGRVGFGQPDSPALPIASIGGVPLLSFVTVLAGLALAELLRRVPAGRVRRVPVLRPGGRGTVAVPLMLLLVAAAAGPLASLVPPLSGAAGRTVTVAAIQGNVPRLGLDFNAQRRAVLDNHARETEVLAREVAAGHRPQPDIVIWPENSSDIDPLRNPDAAARIDEAARAIRAPILVGAVLVNPGRTTSNAALVWEPGVGVVDRQDKRRIQPFGEYMPWRSFFRMFSEYVDRAGYFVPGGGDGLVTIGGVRTAVAICWEIAFDDAFGQAVDAGAQLLAVPSNNATFGLTEMTYQQMAMSRVRAVEFDRPVVVVTTSGVSGMVTRDGAVTEQTGQFVPGVLDDRIQLRETTTMSAVLGSGPEWTLAALGVLAAGYAAASRRRERLGAVKSAGQGTGEQTRKDENG